MCHVEPSIEVLTGDREFGGVPVVIGVPFERGNLRELPSLAVIAPSGKTCAVAGRPLVRWPDGSVRWALLSLQSSEVGAHRLCLSQPSGQRPEVSNPVTLSRSGEQTTIENGLVRVVLGASGPGPVREITALGHAYLPGPEDLRFVVNKADTTHEVSRTVQVMERSQLRTRVRVAGAHLDPSGQRLLNYRLDVELWAGWPVLRMDYQFFHLEPGREEIAIDRIAMEWDAALGKETQRHFVQSAHGLLYTRREVFNAAPVAILADETCGPPHVENPAMLLDETRYPRHLRPPLIATSDWLGVGDGQRSLYIRMQDFAQMRPKRLASSGARLELEIWPSSQGTLKLPQGRSRRQVVTVAFSDQPRLGSAHVQRLLDGPLYEGRAVVQPAYLRQCGEFEADRLIAPAANIRFEKYLRRLVSLGTPQDMFDLGDTIDSGYCRTYIPIPNNIPLKPNAPAMPRVFLAALHSPFADWALPQLYEPVWTNNEYDAIFALCTEIMRTGRAELWTPARWFVRHNIEVDFVHYHDDRQQHHGTPQHSCRHNRSGSVPSHFWTQGLLQYYCMTGDPDVLEVAIALGDRIIEDLTVPELRQTFWGFTRELGWPTLALAHLADITGEERFVRQLEEILQYFMGYAQPPGFERSLARNLVVMACMFEGADLYQRRSRRDDLKAWLGDLLGKVREALEQEHTKGIPVTIIMAPVVMAIGYEQTGDERFLHAAMTSLDELIDTPFWPSPPNETKPMAITYRGLVRFLHHAHQAGLLDRFEYPSVARLRCDSHSPGKDSVPGPRS